jgi:DNA-binding transcriptional ArsR family regulator
MNESARMAAIAALIGDPARANIMNALMDGRALTAKELAFAAHVSPQTASEHLAKLTDGDLLSRQRQGRHHYFRLATPSVGHLLESILVIAGPEPARISTWRGGEALRTARTCYDHIAGRLGVALTDALIIRDYLTLTTDGGEVSDAGRSFLREFGVTPPPGKRVFCRPCLDWSERRPHLAGRLGTSLAERCFDLGWISRLPDTRALAITPAGQRGFADRFGLTVAVTT